MNLADAEINIEAGLNYEYARVNNDPDFWNEKHEFSLNTTHQDGILSAEQINQIYADLIVQLHNQLEAYGTVFHQLTAIDIKIENLGGNAAIIKVEDYVVTEIPNIIKTNTFPHTKPLVFTPKSLDCSIGDYGYNYWDKHGIRDMISGVVSFNGQVGAPEVLTGLGQNNYFGNAPQLTGYYTNIGTGNIQPLPVGVGQFLVQNPVYGLGTPYSNYQHNSTLFDCSAYAVSLPWANAPIRVPWISCNAMNYYITNVPPMVAYWAGPSQANLQASGRSVISFTVNVNYTLGGNYPDWLTNYQHWINVSHGIFVPITKPIKFP